jgi:hypothetical protein
MDTVTAGLWNSLETRKVWPTPPGKTNQPIDLDKSENGLGKTLPAAHSRSGLHRCAPRWKLAADLMADRSTWDLKSKRHFTWKGTRRRRERGKSDTQASG